MPQQLAEFPNMNVCKNVLKNVHGSLHFHDNDHEKLFLSFRTEKNDQEIAEIFRIREIFTVTESVECVPVIRV